MLTDYKITTYQKNIADLADTPNDSGLSPEQLKEMFDGRTDNEVKNAINGIVDTLGSTTGGASGADNIGSAEITGLNEVGTSTTAKTVFKQIKSIFTALTAHIASADNPHAATKAQVGLGSCDNTSDADKPISTATQTALDLKVDKVTGKGLSANDLSDILKASYDGAVEKEHLHANMALLNSYTQSESNLANAVSKTHDHENKTALDTITAVLITAWNNAVTKAHEHSNKTTLDAITSTVKSGYDSLVTMFTGKSITTTLGNDHTTIPTSKAVADAMGQAGYGDMLKSTYDTGNAGKVDTALNAEKLGGNLPSYYATATHTHATGEITGLDTALGGKQDKTDNSLNTTSKIIPDAINEVNTALNTLQPKTDNTLSTTTKTVTGAINELFTSASNGKTLIANAITGKGLTTLATDTYQQMAGNIDLLGDYISRVYYYNLGDENVPITGGWIVGYSRNSGSQSKNSDHLYLNALSGAYRTYVTNILVDLTNIKTLHMEFESDETSASCGTYIWISDTKLDDSGGIANFSKYGSFTRGVVSYDISAVTGSHYIKLSINATSSRTSKIYRLWGEQ